MENAASASRATTSFVGCPDRVRILAVDEDPICLTTLTQMLQRYGYEVTAMSSPEEALREVWQSLEGSSFDLVIAAAHTRGTGMDGFALLEHLHESLPVILFSGEEPFETTLRAIEGGAVDFLIKPLDDHQMRNIWTHVARWRLTAANGSDPPTRGSARVAWSSGEGSSRGIQQQQKKKQCRTTKKTNSNSSSELHALFLQAAELLRGTEGYCPRGIREFLLAQDVEVTLEQAMSLLEMYERDCLTKHLAAKPMAISPRYDNSKNYPPPGSSGPYIRSQGATNIDQTSLLSNHASPVGRGALGNESYRASHVGHLHNNGNHHGSPTCYGNHNNSNSNSNGRYGNGYGHHHGNSNGNGNGNANGYCANDNFYHVGLPANGSSMVSASPSYYNLAYQVQQAMPTTTGLFPGNTTMNDPNPTRQEEFPQASRLSYNSTTGGISMAPWPVPADDDDADLLRSYLGEKDVMLNTAATGMTQGMHGGGAAGQTSSSHPQELTGLFSWETTNGNAAGTSGGSRGLVTGGMECDPSEDDIQELF
uniref:Uncharacterized protein n=1 Tax=Avena sativa TaxID=4498 RepID=A0ACD5TAP4_AVESA